MCSDISELRRKSDTAVLLGSGRSINSITDDQWGKISRCDSWAVNNWVYHPSFVPDFYHIEAKRYNYGILKRRFEQKAVAYRDTKFIFPRGKTIKMQDGTRQALTGIVFEHARRYDYAMLARDPKRTHPALNANYVMDQQLLTKSYDMSVTLVFELLYKMGYGTIVTFGVDLNDSYYFWTNRPECGEVHHQTNKAHEGKPPDKPHATHRILEFIIDFNARWMRPNNREIYVGHEDTALYPYLKLKPL